MSENITSTDIYALVDMTYYAIGCAILSLVGFTGNGLIIFTVAKHSEMRQKSNFLLSSLALADFFTCLGILVAACATFVGYDKNIPQRNCLMIQGVVSYCSSVDNILILLIGIDRLIILRWPIRYAHWPTQKYVTALITVALCFGLLIIIMAVTYVSDTPISLCILPNAFNGIAKQVWQTLNAIVCLGVLVVYVVAGLLVRKKNIEHTTATSISSEYRRLLTSLTIVAAVYVFSTTFPILHFIVFKLIIHLNPLTYQQNAIYTAWAMLIQISCSPFIYYWRNREYRTAIRKILCGRREIVETAVVSMVNNAAPSVAVRARRPTVSPTTIALNKGLSTESVAAIPGSPVSAPM